LQGAALAGIMERGSAVGDDDAEIVEPACKKPKPATVGAPRHWINDYFVRGDKVSSVGL
jgi:hypothetical protein